MTSRHSLSGLNTLECSVPVRMTPYIMRLYGVLRRVANDGLVVVSVASALSLPQRNHAGLAPSPSAASSNMILRRGS